MRSYWTIQTNDSGDVWSNYGTIPRPNDNFPLGTTGTLIPQQLANGGLAAIQPENKYNYEPLQFVWYADTDAVIKAQIESYVKLATRFKIIDHLANEYVGIFTQVMPIWISGISDEFDISATFWRESD